MLIVAVATAWGNRDGGINSFNRSFLMGLAGLKQGHSIVCVVTSVTDEENEEADDVGIQLFKAPAGKDGRPAEGCAVKIAEWLTKRGFSYQEPTVFIGHDVVTGHTAVEAAGTWGGRVALIHHMAYEEYQNLKGGLGEKTGINFDRQQELFETPNATLFGVGSYLADKVASFGDGRPLALIPGFPEEFVRNSAVSDQLRITIAGRFSPEQETLKQAELPIEALGLAIREASNTVKLLEDPVVFIIGVDQDRIQQAKLEKLASRKAGRTVNIVPRPYTDNPNAVFRAMKQSNLAIVPSYHEGFGLVGWEAIGCEVPLILGRKTGLYKFISSRVGRAAVHSIEMKGGGARQKDVRAMADAIIEVAKDLPLAKADAVRLRAQLKNATGCTWKHTAETFLGAFNAHPQEREPRRGAHAKRSQKHFSITRNNVFARCVELSLSENQGSTPQRFDVQADLRFGTEPLVLDDINVELSLRRAHVSVFSRNGLITGPRLGDNPRIKGLDPKAGGVWLVTDPTGNEILGHHALGAEPLCQIETTSGSLAEVTVKVLVSPKDLNCAFDIARRERNSLKEKLMAIVLQKALLDENTGETVFSQADMQQDDVDD